MSSLTYGAVDYVDSRMPMIGLGTWGIKKENDIFQSVEAALKNGYRFIDTAQIYGNEKFIGDALSVLLPKHNLDRNDVFITSKLSPSNQGLEKCKKSVLKSLSDMQTEYIDLFLIHWPGSSRLARDDERNSSRRRESWQCLEKLHNEGKIRSIGVSNFTVTHLQELLQYASVCPAINQCEYHPRYYQNELIEFCRQNRIHFQAYSSLGSELHKDELLNDEKIKKMAEKYDCSVVNFLLAWSLSQGISVLPRSKNPKHIKENFKSKEISINDEDIEAVKLKGKVKYCWDPEDVR